YSYDAAANQILRDGSFFANGSTLEVDTALGGHLTFHFADGGGFLAGDYAYTAPSSVSSQQVETFHYVIEDGDGDQAGADLQITVQNANQAPVNTVPDAQTVAEDTAINFSSGHGNAI